MKNKEKILGIIEYLAVLVLLVGIFRILLTPIVVYGSSMEPTYHEHQYIITHMFLHVDRFDCVTIETDGKMLIKRVIGLPGETIEYRDNQLYINGELVDDPYGFGNTDNFTYTIGNGYFCMGDNREHSCDSRYYGEFNISQLESKVNW